MRHETQRFIHCSVQSNMTENMLVMTDEGGLKAYCVAQGICFLKPSENPASVKIFKTKRPVGSIIYTTGRTWKGPQGGLWAEVDVVHCPGEMGWVLVEGPGFGMKGPVLVDPSGTDNASVLINVRWLKDPPIFSCMMPKTATVGDLLENFSART